MLTVILIFICTTQGESTSFWNNPTRSKDTGWVEEILKDGDGKWREQDPFAQQRGLRLTPDILATEKMTLRQQKHLLPFVMSTACPT